MTGIFKMILAVEMKTIMSVVLIWHPAQTRMLDMFHVQYQQKICLRIVLFAVVVA
jgi:hypothetical protein